METQNSVVETPVVPEKKKEILSPAAFELYGCCHEVIAWPEVQAAFPGYIESDRQVSAEEFIAFANEWLAKHPGVKFYSLTPKADKEWKQRGHFRLIKKDEIEKELFEKLGKTWGITFDEIDDVLRSAEDRTGFGFDGDPVACYIHGGKFQPVMRYLLVKGKPARKPDDSYRMLGEFTTIKEMVDGKEKLKIVAVCGKCRKERRDELHELQLSTHEEAQGFLEREERRREKARAEEEEENARAQMLVNAAKFGKKITRPEKLSRRNHR